MKIDTIEKLNEIEKNVKAESTKYKFLLTACSGTGCRATDCLSVWDALNSDLKKRNMLDQVKLRQTGCHGFCEQGPLLIIEPGNIFYCRIKPDDVEDIVTDTLLGGKIIDRLLYVDEVAKKKIQKELDIPFYKAQDRKVLGRNKMINPEDINEYIGVGGYKGIAKALKSMKPDDIIEEIKKSGLRGMGGGGFLTGKKWELCKNAGDEIRYLICNADEGDPGAYMDRSILEGNPHSVIEGMLIGGYAIGAQQGYIYVRNEYPLAVENATTAINHAREAGLLGKNIFGTEFSFDIKIARGGGAFVCGEETGLIKSIEGKVGEPYVKPPYPVQKGLLGKPTLVNNVETWANVAFIISNGHKVFSEVGTKTSKGTKIFALTGKIKNTGLVEVSMGTKLKDIVYKIGGGPLEGGKIKALQTGGPSGGCIPESMFDLPIDFDELTKVGSMMGSGGIVVMDENSCMVDVAKYFLNFILDESCGVCSTCRIGTSRMLEILDDITEGRGTLEQLDLLQDLAETISVASLCALGRTAPNPVLSTLKYFRNEYEAHILEKRCPAKVCRELIRYQVVPDKCIGCGVCLKVCPHGAVTGEVKKLHTIHSDKCTKCGMCKEHCKFDAIIVI